MPSVQRGQIRRGPRGPGVAPGGSPGFAPALAALACGLLLSCGSQDASAPLPDGATPTAGFAGSGSCRGCHAEAYGAWQGTHHARALATIGENALLGDFDDVLFEGTAFRVRFERRGERPWVVILHPDADEEAYPVAFGIGTDPLEQLLLELPGGRLQAFPVAWNTHEKRWMELPPPDVSLASLAPGDWLHWTGAAYNANSMCIECHTTAFDTGFDPERHRYASTWSEPGVGCEACHGPRRQHVDAMSAQPDATGPSPTRPAAPADRNLELQHRELERCGACHSRRTRSHVGPSGAVGFDVGYRLEPLREGLYFDDGQIRDEVYVVGSFLSSRMAASGVRCSHCHDPHTTAPIAKGNALCTQCHDASLYDTEAHHHHRPESLAAQCVECHMRERTYMQVDARRDHGFHLPRPDLTLRFGVPNACNGCHTERDAAWARDRVVQWYGPTRPNDFHATAVLAAARSGSRDAGAALLALQRSEDAPAILRATALDELARRRDPELGAAVAGGLHDPDPLVRTAATSALEALDRAVRKPLLEARLEDPLPAIRIEAARLLAQQDPGRVRAPFLESNQPLVEGFEEFLEVERSLGDQPTSLLNRALAARTQGALERARALAARAVRLDPAWPVARLLLAELLDAAGAGTEAETTLREGLRRQPEQGRLRYALGLVLAADPERADETAAALARAADRLPRDPRVQYNAGLAAQRVGRIGAATALLEAALALTPTQPDFLYARAVLALQTGDRVAALEAARTLAAKHPGDPRLATLLRQLR